MPHDQGVRPLSPLQIKNGTEHALLCVKQASIIPISLQSLGSDLRPWLCVTEQVLAPRRWHIRTYDLELYLTQPDLPFPD